MDGINALTTLGMAFLATGDWSLIRLGASVFSFFMSAFSPSLMVHIVLLNQDSSFRMGEDDINAFIRDLFHDGDCEWSCNRCKLGDRLEGVSRSSIHVTLIHRNRRCNDPSKHAVIRDLCRKLVGRHTALAYKFRVVPQWETPYMTDDDKFFGSCLILMQLKDFYDNFSTTSAQEDSEKSDWVK
ncbi:hypothetical protein B0J14DRAFT_2627 [Halenospora varia]|nr:hypothetical protein B0J14DRAFT_2627 [Halenospora varia]